MKFLLNIVFYINIKKIKSWEIEREYFSNFGFSIGFFYFDLLCL